MHLPQIGYGTFYATDKVRLKAALHYAIEECGIRSIDTVWSYFNQEIIGETLQEIFSKGIITRKDIFITSKLWNTHHRPDLVEKELLQTLHQLKLDYIDLFLIHTPASFKSIEVDENKKITDDDAFPRDETGKIIIDDIHILDTYRAMEAVQIKGLCRFIGVSNLNQIN
ncbi:oxidoreductase, aldo/keto reductase family protein [Trichomonas vaginalis G3]|uniref:Oxidoreductase, aldo/keto reductase family protein n=1 Tax=Trichomonas vaginalis (strain ATCC PRA-98 / G3) TaxID=412133 RepID=A2G8W5_TRIV3|nr:oxidoreductase protein [Trichomonas vaginalis G3]EAX86400.1 oxidoreductase, aldo/keto reductase family protein [Trichomonas vaginalis G3]KAI5505381.1 oxidoreductase protein [Trichomonas vaginalis G3]|eukprot:XP_001299330.1 oxidoreductase, aldo/keto reductase family protein [Trichomonas vaginalis G3]